MKTTTSPEWNGPEISPGKNDWPVSSAALSAGSVPITSGPSSCCTGFTPRNAANTLPTGGSAVARATASAGTPAAARPEPSVEGSDRASPAMSSEKNTPIDSTVPAFIAVARMPEATPRWLAGTLLITAEVFGAEKSPEPIPFSAISVAKAQYGKSTGSSSSPRNVAATSSSPPVDSSRAPCRSDSRPDSGPAARKPAVSGSR